MTIREPFDQDYAPAYFHEGTRTVYFHEPMNHTPNNTRYYVARRFQLDEGEYQIKLELNDGGTLWLGESSTSSRMVMSAYENGNPPVPTGSVYVQGGDYRMDLIIDNLGTVESECFFRMNIFKDGALVYVSTKDGWLVDENIISDDDLPPLDDPRWKLPVFSVMPNWKEGLLERLSWMTDVMDSETDAEQRRPVRRHARRSFEAGFLRQNTDRTRLDTFFVGLGTRPFLVPLWHEQVIAVEGITAGSPRLTFATADLAVREFRAGDMALINNGDPSDYDVLLIATVDADSIDWATPPERHWPPGTRVFPMRTARVMEPANMQQITDRVATARVRFSLQEPYEVAESFGATQNGLPVFGFMPNRADVIDTSYSRRNYTLDNDAAPIVVTDMGIYSVINVKASLLLAGRNQVYAYRQFIAAARGRARHFYCQSFENDVHPVGDIPAGATYIVTEPTGYLDYMSDPQATRTMMAFYMDTGGVVYANIVNVIPKYKVDQDNVVIYPLQIVGEIFMLEAPLPAIKLDDVSRISFISETRFDQDDFELFHHSDGSHAVAATVVMRQTKNPRIGGIS